MGFWTPSAWYLASALHVFAAVAVMYAAAYHFRASIWRVAAIVAIVTGIKEYLIDTGPFERDTLAGSTQDWLCYLIGTAAVVVAVRWRLLGGAAVAAGEILALFIIDALKQHGVGL